MGYTKRKDPSVAFLMGCEGAHLEFPAKLVLDDVTLGVHEGDRIGIVGKNGDGKSTLLGVLAGQIELEGGLVRRTRGLTVGVLGQTDSLSDDATVGYSVVGDAPEYEWASDPRIREIISGAHRRHRLEREGWNAFGRPATKGRSYAPAYRRLRRHHDGRAHQPLGHSRHCVACAAPQ